MADITELKVGKTVKCVFPKSPFFGRIGVVVGYEHDGWIRVVFTDDDVTRICHPNDLEITRLVDYEQYAKLRQEADDLHEENRKLTTIMEKKKDE